MTATLTPPDMIVFNNNLEDQGQRNARTINGILSRLDLPPTT